ncbi:MAG: hypothetical protein Q8R02_20410 [Hyphomonadaceae bacterium]|nr:hypothetical protein [Hyphomonadaceae bacterium]
MKSILTVIAAALACAPAFAQDVSISKHNGKEATAAEAAQCVAYYRAEAKLHRPANAPFEETLRGQAWKSYLDSLNSGIDPRTLIAKSEKDMAAALAKSKTDWRKPYETSCSEFEKIS